MTSTNGRQIVGNVQRQSNVLRSDFVFQQGQRIADALAKLNGTLYHRPVHVGVIFFIEPTSVDMRLDASLISETNFRSL